jgi:plasmid maintenance system antidote protein VapI
MSARELARAIKVPTTRITDILRGRRGITGDTRCALANILE